MVNIIDKELIHYFTRLDESQKRTLLEMMKAFLKPMNESEPRTTVRQYNQELDDAMLRISRGEFTTLAELEKEMQSW